MAPIWSLYSKTPLETGFPEKASTMMIQMYSFYRSGGIEYMIAEMRYGIIQITWLWGG
jgi:hypothetical protein